MFILYFPFCFPFFRTQNPNVFCAFRTWNEIKVYGDFCCFQGHVQKYVYEWSMYVSTYIWLKEEKKSHRMGEREKGDSKRYGDK